MPDDIYECDILAWSQRQADLLRRLGRGERVNEVNWASIAEEIEDVGLSELHAVESFLNLLLLHLLKLHTSPNSQACAHWHSEIVAFRNNAKRGFTPLHAAKDRLGLLVCRGSGATAGNRRRHAIAARQSIRSRSSPEARHGHASCSATRLVLVAPDGGA